MMHGQKNIKSDWVCQDKHGNKGDCVKRGGCILWAEVLHINLSGDHTQMAVL